MKTFKYFCNQRQSYYKKLNEAAPVAPAAPQSKQLPVVQKGIQDLQAAMQKNPADPNLGQMATTLSQSLSAWVQELQQAAKAQPAATPGQPAPAGQPAATPGQPAPAGQPAATPGQPAAR